MAAASEERFSRVKHDPSLPVRAFRFCLRQAGLTITDLEGVAYFEEPVRKLSRQLWSLSFEGPVPSLDWLDPHAPERAIREQLGFEGPVLKFPHHLCHGASAFYFSGFRDAAVFTADAVGEWATTSYGRAGRDGTGGDIDVFEEVLFPHSLGLFYSTVTSYLGFGVNDGEYKVMGLAAFGEPRYLDEVCQLLGMGDGGQFRLNLRFFEFLGGERMFSDELIELFGRPPREPDEPIEGFHQDVARSAQLLLEEVLLEKAAWLHEQTGSENLCYAGGVALNSAANGRLRRESPFNRIFVQPAAGDAGACLGAAALAHRTLAGTSPRSRQRHAYLGPDIAPAEVESVLDSCGLERSHYLDEPELIEDVAERLASGQIVGWVQGRMEHGPRALGARSLLAAPFDPAVRDQINAQIKRRETFRPFAPSVPRGRASEFFDIDQDSLLAPFMLETCRVISPILLGAVTHVDGTARPQLVDPAVSPRFAALLEAFGRRTGVPVLLNTSLNGPGEPIVATVADALRCIHRLGQDNGLSALVLSDFVIDRSDLPEAWQDLAPNLDPLSSRAAPSGIDHRLYTFV